jgi:hypothetical protein
MLLPDMSANYIPEPNRQSSKLSFEVIVWIELASSFGAGQQVPLITEVANGDA